MAVIVMVCLCGLGCTPKGKKDEAFLTAEGPPVSSHGTDIFSIKSEPPGAAIFLNSVYKGKAPVRWRRTKLPQSAKTYEIEAKLSGRGRGIAVGNSDEKPEKTKNVEIEKWGSIFSMTFRLPVAGDMPATKSPGQSISEASGPQTAGNSEEPELVLQRGHSQWVRNVCFNSRGTQLLTAGGDATAKLWDVRTGNLVHTFRHSATQSEVIDTIGKLLPMKGEGTNIMMEMSARLTGASVEAIAFSPDDRLAVSGGVGDKICVWDVVSGDLRKTLSVGSQDCEALEFSPDGRYLFSASDYVRIWNTRTWALSRMLRNLPDVKEISCSADGQFLACGSSSGVRMYSRRLERIVETFEDGRRTVFSPDGKHLAVWSIQDTLSMCSVPKLRRVWQKETGECDMAFTPAGRALAVASGWDIHLYNAKNGRLMKSLEPDAGDLSGVSFVPDGSALATGMQDNTAKLISLSDGRVLTQFGSPPRSRWANITINYEAAASSWSPDSRYIATAILDNVVTVWDAQTGRTAQVLEGCRDYITDVAFMANAGRVAASTLNELRLWDVKSGREIREFDVPGKAAFATGGYLTAVRGSSKLVRQSGKTAYVYDASTGEHLYSLSGHERNIKAVSASKDGQTIVTGGVDRKVILWDATEGTRRRTLTGHTGSVQAVDISPDGRLVASGGWDRTVALWDASTGERLRVLRHPDYLYSVEFSPDGRFLATGCRDAVIRLWNPSTGRRLRSLKGHTREVESISFSPEGTRLVSASWDGTARLWNTASGACMATMVASGDSHMTLADGFYTASRNAYNLVAWRQATRMFPFESFDLVFNRPDLVAKKLGCKDRILLKAYRNAYLKRLKRMNFKETDLGTDMHLPKARLHKRGETLEMPSERLTVNVRAWDAKYKIDRFILYVNGVPEGGSRGFSLRNRSTNRYENEVDVTLSSGTNTIELVCYNQKGVASLPDSMEVFCTKPALKPSLRLVSIGVSDYVDDAYDLQYAAKDARDIAHFISGRENAFDQIITRVIVDENATKERIQGTKVFLAESSVDDFVVVFLAGHGLLDKKLDYFFATADTDFGNPGARALSYESIADLTDGIPARRKLLLLDTCHSGELDTEDYRLAQSSNPPGVRARAVRGFKVKKQNTLGLASTVDVVRELFADLRAGSGTFVISSAGGAEFALESIRWENGVFTASLLKGLQSAQSDQNGDGSTTVSELNQFVANRVRTLTNGRQTPTSRSVNLDFDFALDPLKSE